MGGLRNGCDPRNACKSDPQIPAAFTFIRTLCSSKPGTSNSFTTTLLSSDKYPVFIFSHLALPPSILLFAILKIQPVPIRSDFDHRNYLLSYTPNSRSCSASSCRK